MSHTPELLRVIEQNELDKTSRCVRLVDSNGVFALAVDEKYGGLVAAAPDMLRILESVLSLIDESSGVVGYHLNGEVATWKELGIREEVEAAIRKARGEE